jgi:hypothetical protein
MFPQQDDGTLALTCVWHNGKIDVRNIENGENYRKTQLDGEVASVFVADIQQSQRKQLLLAYYNGKGLDFSKIMII